MATRIANPSFSALAMLISDWQSATVVSNETL
jgi:hypothetical protein